MRTVKTLVAGDIHVPFHDARAVDLLVAVVGEVQPERFVYGGDILDCYELSDYDKDPERIRTQSGLQGEIDRGAEIFQRIRDAAPAACVFEAIPGNHELRLRRVLARNPGLAGLRVLEFPSLLRLDEFGIRFHAHELPLANGNFVIKHGMATGDQAARKELAREYYSVSGLTHHVHKYTTSGLVSHRQGVVGWWSNGCLCSLTPEYMHRPNWQQGVSLVYERGDTFHCEPVPFLGHKAMIEGAIVRAH